MSAIPPPLCARAELLARAHPIATVAELTGIDRGTVYALRARGWRALDPGRNRRARPTDFAIWSGRESREQLRLRYRTGPQVIQRWRHELAERERRAPGA